MRGKTRRVIGGLTMMVAAMLPAKSAAAQPSDEQFRCEGGGGASPDQQIDACTAIIGSRRQPQDIVASAFIFRGLAYGTNGQYDRATEDLDEAIRLNPGSVTAF